MLSFQDFIPCKVQVMPRRWLCLLVPSQPLMSFLAVAKQSAVVSGSQRDDGPCSCYFCISELECLPCTHAKAKMGQWGPRSSSFPCLQQKWWQCVCSPLSACKPLLRTHLKNQNLKAFVADHNSTYCRLLAYTDSGFVSSCLCLFLLIIVDGFNCHFSLMLTAQKDISIIYLQEQRGSSEVPICLLWLQGRAPWALRCIVFSGTKISL